MDHTPHNRSICIMGHEEETNSGEMDYYSGKHCRRLGAVRRAEQLSLKRSKGKLGPAEENLLRVNCSNVIEENTELNVQLANAIGTRWSPMHRTLKDKPVVSVVFYSYLSIEMLPDHLVIGLIEERTSGMLCKSWNKCRSPSKHQIPCKYI